MKKPFFTLAETIVVLVILGVIATLVVPTLINKNKERTNKTKIKKALAAYENVINKMVIEDGLRSKDLINNTISKNNNCANLHNYFQTVENRGCVFKTADGLWWDIGKNATMTKAMVAFKDTDLTVQNASLDNNKKAFYFITDFDENGILRVLDSSYGYNTGNSEYIVSTAKTWAYINDKNIMDYYKLCSDTKKPISCVMIDGNKNLAFYNENKQKVIFLYNCASPGIGCKSSRKDKNFTTSDERVNVRVECGLQGANCNKTTIYAGPITTQENEKQYFSDLIGHLRPDFEFNSNTLSYEKLYNCSSVTEDHNDSSCNHTGYYLHVNDSEGKSHNVDGSNAACYENPTPGCRYRDYYDWQWFIWE